MDFYDELKALGERSRQKGPSLLTEEATKTALVMPFIKALGYDVFNIDEVVPEFVATGSDRKDQRVDYAIMKDGKPVILIECKAYGTDLCAAGLCDQLRRYFNFVDSATVAVLTDGNVYKFFTDLSEDNKMEKTPYMTFSLEKIDKNLVPEIQKLGKDKFNPDEAFIQAEKLKYTGLFKKVFTDTLEKPADELVMFFLNKAAYEGKKTAKVVEKYRPILKDALNNCIADKINERFTAAMSNAEKERKEKEEADEAKKQESADQEAGVVTTDLERQAFYIVKGLLTGVVPLDKITLRDKQTLCNILFDDNIRKPIIQLYFDEDNLAIGLVQDDKSKVRVKIEKVEDIYNYADQIKHRVMGYLNGTSEKNPAAE